MHPTTPESILARFAAEYAEHGPGPERRLSMTLHFDNVISGYIGGERDDLWKIFYRDGDRRGSFITSDQIHRIDYSNARYRGAAPLWEREG